MTLFDLTDWELSHERTSTRQGQSARTHVVRGHHLLTFFTKKAQGSNQEPADHPPRYSSTHTLELFFCKFRRLFFWPG